MDKTINETAKAFNSKPLKGKAAKPPLIPINGNNNEPQTGHPDAKAPAKTPLPESEPSFAILFLILNLCKIMETLSPNKTDIIKFDANVK